MFLSMSREELASKGAILIEHVEDGFRQYQAVIVKGGKKEMEQFLIKCREMNHGNAYADFHYPLLDAREQEQFREGLDEAAREFLSGFEVKTGQIYYPLTESSLGFLAEITAEEWLFSTFFFTECKAVIWGNYKLEYPLFCETAEILTLYKRMAAECGLEIIG